ncbi:hypothetical protein SAMN05878503_104117 [Cereibacter ovatus]|uniref:DUF721 domain-containing protein n=1 Tax=Cereibacter ovatus TaxID=439529 RepID=A0A285CPW0_9RHOB|nr:DUF721 domain-containing protein [Cereibacter ovatus]SNX69592.1 hypothetical protein SAMN05878503_104117 [Cereibacter ovatus]
MTRAPAPTPAKPKRRMRGFEAASGLLQDRIRQVGEKRGFAVTRLLTHWPEVAGTDLARITRPVKVGYAAREGLGATLTILVSSAHAPLVQMQLPALKERVNACYGYAAISRILLTQTAPAGFAEGQATFDPAPKAEKAPDPAVQARAAEAAAGVHDEGLRAALERLTMNFLTRTKAR